MASIDRPIRLPRVHRRRRHQRGVALVEAAFMLPMFVILWYGSLYVHNLGSKYIAVNTAAREDAWTTAMSNCGVHKSSDSEVLPAAEGSPSPLKNGGGSDSSAVSTALGQGNVTGAISGLVNSITKAISNIFPNPKGATALKTDKINWRDPDLYDHSGMAEQSTKVKGTITIVCNEAPEDGSISNVIGNLVGFVKSIF
jgi:hypothetical protein